MADRRRGKAGATRDADRVGKPQRTGVGRPLTAAVDLDVPLDRAIAVLRSDLLCWLPPAIAGQSPGGWATAVRRGVLQVHLEAEVGSTWIGDDDRLSRHLVLDPRGGTASGLGAVLATRLTAPVDGHLILEPGAGGPELRFEGRTRSRNPLRRRLTRVTVTQLLEDIARRLPTAPTMEDSGGRRGHTVVRCPVMRPV
jgi:hypothetical protein